MATAPHAMRRLLSSLILAASVICVSCSSPDREPSIGEAYVGPATLTLRLELAPKSPVSATVKHGDHLEILATRRRFLKVRTPDDKEGWVDGYQLLTPQQMADLKDLAIRAQKLPSQGSATVYDVLNMHTEPNRQAPSFYQIPEKGVVEVVGHKVSPRGLSATTPAVAASIKAEPAHRKHSSRPTSSHKLGPPPPPAPPKPPPNWVDISKSNKLEPVVVPVAVSNKPKLPGPKPQLTEEEKALILEDWSLVRTRDGRVGWVLTRPLVMSIPDEVAQYAEGRRITSYFALGIEREGSTKQNWLWTTAQKGVEPFEFDAVRVFVFNNRHKRYETAFSERNLKGYYPVEVSSDDSGGTVTRFSYIVEDDQGNYFRKHYSFIGHSARLISREPFHLADPKEPQKGPVSIAQAPPAEQRSWYERTKDAVGKQWKRWFN